MKYLTITSESFRHEVSAQVEVTNEVFHERSHALNGRNPSVELNQCNSRAFVHDEIHPRDGIQPLKPGSDLLTFFFFRCIIITVFVWDSKWLREVCHLNQLIQPKQLGLFEIFERVTTSCNGFLLERMPQRG